MSTVACGMVSQYNLAPGDRYPIKNLFHIIGKRIKFQGFIQGDANMRPKYAKDRDEKVSAVSYQSGLSYLCFQFNTDGKLCSGWQMEVSRLGRTLLSEWRRDHRHWWIC